MFCAMVCCTYLVVPCIWLNGCFGAMFLLSIWNIVNSSKKEKKERNIVKCGTWNEILDFGVLEVLY